MSPTPSACHPERSAGPVPATAILGLLLVIGSPGCAVPGEPLPPLLEIPARARDLTAAQVGNHVELKWSPIQLTTEGTLPREFDRIDFYAAYLASGVPLTDFGEQARLIHTFTNLRQEDLDMITVRAGERIAVDGSDRGKTAHFAIKAVNRRGNDAGFSNIAAVEIVDLPAPPAALAAEVSEPAILLRWKNAERSVFGGLAPATDGYEVFRATAGSNAPAISLGTSSSASFRDSAFSFGERYRYTVRAFVARGESRAFTLESEALEVSPLDRFAPAPPANLRAIAVTGAVELAWSPNAEADLAGYNIYREPLGEDGRAIAPRRKLNDAPLDIPLYRDAGAVPASRFRYTATAVDRDGNESAASNEETVETE